MPKTVFTVGQDFTRLKQTGQ
uniref:Uncharacterized protein n=1 Tax=Anguilla anguilla TaxID=7936 RepID=A0A0E9VIN5_ANGAN